MNISSSSFLSIGVIFFFTVYEDKYQLWNLSAFCGHWCYQLPRYQEGSLRKENNYLTS